MEESRESGERRETRETRGTSATGQRQGSYSTAKHKAYFICTAYTA